MQIKIGNSIIGKGQPCYVIAEIGINHNGNIGLAKKMILAAKDAGANAVKFQAYKTKSLVDESNKEAFSIFNRAELSKNDFIELKQFCEKKKIDFFASVFDFESVDIFLKLDSPCFKIASGELTNTPLLIYIAKKNKPILLSIGMASEEEIQYALEAIYLTGNKQVVLFHCVSEYPAPFEKLNLKKILTLEEHFKVPTGFSDHSIGVNASVVAVALGAVAIEKHFTIDKSLPGPDQKMSIDSKELKNLVDLIRKVEIFLGDGSLDVAEKIENTVLFRKSIFAFVDIMAGEKITADKIEIRRPASGIKPKDFNKILGKKALVKINAGAPLLWEKIEK